MDVEPLDVAALLAQLQESKRTVAVAESLTGGLICASLTAPSGASAVVRGGLVVYATDLKHQLAGVDERWLDVNGPVNAEVARQLARGARSRLGADIGLGVTGVAGPDQQAGHPVGEAHWAVAGPAGQLLDHSQFLGDGLSPGATAQARRADIRNQVVQAALRLLAEAVREWN